MVLHKNRIAKRARGFERSVPANTLWATPRKQKVMSKIVLDSTSRINKLADWVTKIAEFTENAAIYDGPASECVATHGQNSAICCMNPTAVDNLFRRLCRQLPLTSCIRDLRPPI